MAPDIVVHKTPDQMKAFVFVPETLREVYPTKVELLEKLASACVLHGIQEKAVEHMVEKRVCNRRVLVAEGTPPIAGTHGKLQLLVDTSARGKPRQRDDGGVNHRDLQLIYNVHVGSPLMRRIPPVPGKPGATVKGERIEPPPVKVAEFNAGVGTRVADDDPDMLVAACDGQVLVERDGRISVTDSRIIRGDIDYATGNISVIGDLRVTGSVRAGFEIRARGNVTIGGNIEDARVYCTGDLTIVGGAVGSAKALIRCGGAVTLHHVEGFCIDSDKDVTVAEDAVHAQLMARGTVKLGAIVGGSVSAGAGVIAGTIGTSAESRTVVELGGAYRLRMEKQDAEKQLEENSGLLQELRDRIFQHVRDRMDSNGTMTSDDEERLIEFKKQLKDSNAERKKLEKKLHTIEESMATALAPVIKADEVFPNTVLRFGPMEKVIREQLNRVVISAEFDRITITSQS